MDKKAVDFIADVASGLTDKDLQKKYGLLDHRFPFYKAAALDLIARNKAERNQTRRKIKAQEFLHDLKAGLDDSALMNKYLLNHRQLQSALRQLIKLGLVTPLEVSDRLSITKSQVTQAFVEMGKAIKELD
jgi:hypothetical protein